MVMPFDLNEEFVEEEELRAPNIIDVEEEELRAPNIIDVEEEEIDVEEEELRSPNIDVEEEDLHPPDMFDQAAELFLGDDNPNIMDEIGIPKHGMKFMNGDECASFLFAYAYVVGFEWFVRASRLLPEYREKGVTRRAAGEKEPRFFMLKRMRLVCKKGGTNNSKNSNTTGCKAYAECRIIGLEMVITKCDLNHNHPLFPKNRDMMVGYRRVSDYFKKRMLLNDSAGIPIHKNYNSLAMEAGGHDKLPFTKRDMRNLVNGERRKGRLTGDAAGLEKYLDKLKRENPDYFFAIETDDDGVLVNLFWSDPRCRAMAKDFGDAVSFDTTFLCNRYSMPFAPFTGVNHHGSSVLLAAALVSHEDIRSFEWVFERWLECMGKAPSVILTDQDKAIGSAIKKVFPNTRHRLCIWHIMRNGQKHLGKKEAWEAINHRLLNVVHDCIEVNEFEGAWNEMVNEFGLEDNAWLKESYEIRAQWAPPYWKSVFCAGMSSTQRSEGLNRYMKDYVSQNTDLSSFVKQIENALHSKAVEENNLNFLCLNSPPTNEKSILAMDVFHKVYTNNKINEVKEEVYGLLHTNLTVKDEVGSFRRYEVTEKLSKPCWNKWWKTFNVEIDMDKVEFSCECKLFEFKGILCKHIIRTIEVAEIKCIPEKYILDRWRRDLVRDYERVKVSYYDPNGSDRVNKVLDIAIKNDIISRLAMQDDEAFEKYQRASDALIKELEEHIGIKTMETGENQKSKVFGRRRLQEREKNQRHIARTATPNDGGLKDPPNKRGNGRAARGKQKTYGKKRAKLDDLRPTGDV